jgi:hypothetical protein
MRKLGIYKTRVPYENLKKITLPINKMFLEYALKSREIYERNGIIFSKEFVGLESFGNLSPILLQEAIQNQQGNRNGSVEMMCHPGYPAETGVPWIRS